MPIEKDNADVLKSRTHTAWTEFVAIKSKELGPCKDRLKMISAAYKDLTAEEKEKLRQKAEERNDQVAVDRNLLVEHYDRRMAAIMKQAHSKLGWHMKILFYSPFLEDHLPYTTQATTKEANYIAGTLECEEKFTVEFQEIICRSKSDDQHNEHHQKDKVSTLTERRHLVHEDFKDKFNAIKKGKPLQHIPWSRFERVLEDGSFLGYYNSASHVLVSGHDFSTPCLPSPNILKDDGLIIFKTKLTFSTIAPAHILSQNKESEHMEKIKTVKGTTKAKNKYEISTSEQSSSRRR